MMPVDEDVLYVSSENSESRCRWMMLHYTVVIVSDFLLLSDMSGEPVSDRGEEA